MITSHPHMQMYYRGVRSKKMFSGGGGGGGGADVYVLIRLRVGKFFADHTHFP